MKSIKQESIFNKKMPSIIILSFMYVFIGFFSKNKIINPLDPTTTVSNVELIVPIVAAIIFGGFIGGGVGASGLIILEIVERLSGNINTPFDLQIAIQAVSYFVGIWVIGKFSENRTPNYSVLRLVFKPHFWYRIFVETLTTILGIALVYPLIYYLLSLIIYDPQSIDNELYIQLFTTNLLISILVIPLVLVLYELIEVLRHKREKQLDEDHKKIDIEMEQEGPGRIISATFDQTAFRIGQWTPIHIKFRHTWKAARSYEIETISTSRIYPHIDSSPVLQENQRWTHVIYVLPLKQEVVNLKIRLIPSYTKKFRNENKTQTVFSLSAPTYIKRDTLLVSVVFLSEVIIFLFLFSILWSQLVTIFSDLVLRQDSPGPQISVPWDTLLIIGIVELLFFLPFLVIMYLWQRGEDSSLQVNDLAFAQDITTHKYSSFDPKDRRILILKRLFLISIALVLITVSAYFTYWFWDYTNSLDQLASSLPIELIFYFLGLIIMWTVTLVVMKNSFDFLSTPMDREFSHGKFIESIKSVNQFQIYKPNQLYFSVRNQTKLPGLRLVFKGNDSISPPLIELHLAPGESAEFKVGITPMSKGDQDILIVVYPLFDKGGNYISIEESKPLSYQNIEYKVLGETIIGITKSQMNTLKHIFGWGSLIASTISIANRYVGVEEVLTQWRDTIPWLVSLQIPFVYLYFIFTNKFITSIQAY